MALVTGQLDSTYKNLISDMMAIERQPLTKLNTQKQTLAVQKGVYTDLQSKLESLKNAVQTLNPSDSFFDFSTGRKVAVSSNTTGSTVATAAVSTNAVPGSYTISNITLAKAHKVMSDRQQYSDQALGYTGTITIGGNATRTIASVTANTNMDAATVSTGIDSSKQELGSGDYYLETRIYNGVNQFRLVDSEGNAATIRNGTSTTLTTSNWQSMPAAGDFDTGRGLTLHFTGTNFEAHLKDNGAAKITYAAKGASLDIAATDSLVNIATKINSANYGQGNEVSASIIDNQLILTNKYSGSAHSIKASDTSGSILANLGILTGSTFKNEIQTSSNATFRVNGMTVTRSQNTALTNVISGVTLNLANDAEGTDKAATLSITSDTTTQKTAVQTFVTQFNNLQAYLKDKTAVTKNADGTYTRAALASDAMISSLRSELDRVVTKTFSNSGTLDNLSDIGIGLDDNNKLSIKDSSKLEDALTSNFNEMKTLLSSVMTGMMNKIGRFTGTNSYVTNAIKSATTQTDYLTTQIKSWEERLQRREQSLYDTYAAAQTQLTMANYQMQQLQAGFSSLNISG
jgi:flagellar hook-associated protein 2